MKAGFKPKKMTKKEWQDNRDSVAKGSGVGKALELWQKNCPYDLNGATSDDIKKAKMTCKAVITGLDVATKKCDKAKHKDLLAGISKYRVIVTDYQKCLEDASKKISARDKYKGGITGSSAIRKDGALENLYLKWAKGPGSCMPEAHGYLLLEDMKLAEFYKKYAAKRAVNIPSDAQNTFDAKFKQGQKIDDKALKTARNRSRDIIHQMLRARILDFTKSQMFAEHIQRKFMVPSFSF